MRITQLLIAYRGERACPISVKMRRVLVTEPTNSINESEKDRLQHFICFEIQS